MRDGHLVNIRGRRWHLKPPAIVKPTAPRRRLAEDSTELHKGLSTLQETVTNLPFCQLVHFYNSTHRHIAWVLTLQ